MAELNAQSQATGSILSTLSPLLQSYSESMQSAQSSQTNLQANLRSVLAALKAAQSEYKESNTSTTYDYAARVEALRKRLESVAYTMNRVQLRLENLQGIVTKEEKRQREEREKKEREQ